MGYLREALRHVAGDTEPRAAAAVLIRRPRATAVLAAVAFLSTPLAVRAGAPAAVASSSLGGEVVLAAGTTLLVRRANALEVVIPAPGASFAGFAELRQLQPGDAVRYEVVGEKGGVRLAGVIEVAPAIATDAAHAVAPADAESFVREGLVLPIDVRAEADSEAGHLRGARQVSPARASAVASSLPADRATRLLFYGEHERSPHAFTAARAALAAGYTDVQVLQGGLRAWRALGLPTWVSARHLLRHRDRGYAIADVRPRGDAERGMVPGSVSVPLEELVPGLVSGGPWLPPLVLVGKDGADARVLEAADRVKKARAQDQVAAVQPVLILDGGFDAWTRAGGAPARLEDAAPVETLVQAPPPQGAVGRAEFEAAWAARGEGRLLLDVRQRGSETPEFAKHVPLEALHERIAELPRDREILVFCHVGNRSRVAWEILTRSGLRARYLRDRPPPR